MMTVCWILSINKEGIWNFISIFIHTACIYKITIPCSLYGVPDWKLSMIIINKWRLSSPELYDISKFTSRKSVGSGFTEYRSTIYYCGLVHDAIVWRLEFQLSSDYYSPPFHFISFSVRSTRQWYIHCLGTERRPAHSISHMSCPICPVITA